MRWSNFHFVFVLNQFYIAKIQYAEIILLKIFFEIAITKMDDTNKKLHISQILQVTCKKTQKTDIQLLDWDHKWRFYKIRVLHLSEACIKKKVSWAYYCRDTFIETWAWSMFINPKQFYGLRLKYWQILLWFQTHLRAICRTLFVKDRLRVKKSKKWTLYD